MNLPEKTLQELGWPRLMTALEGEARTAFGREHTAALPFLSDRASVERHLNLVEESRTLGQLGLELPLDALDPHDDPRPHLQRAAREGVLEAAALRGCARLIRTAVRVGRFLAGQRTKAPLLAGVASGLSDFEPLAAELERAIAPDGTLSDDASPMLAELRGRTRGLHRSLKGRIDELLHDVELEEVLRDRYYTIRDERYVVPVKASHRSQMPGIVHNASQSGQTLFVEPEQLVELGNQLTIAQSMAEEEERRILRDLTEAVGRRSPELEADVGLLAELDRLGACGRLSARMDALTPLVEEADAPFVLRRLRHPLLVLRDVPVIGNDVALEPDRRGLIISGPNAGGKTVTLTAVGLCALMLRAGLPVPAGEGSRLPLYESVFTAIGDEGDLSRDLSTFTAHLVALRDIAAHTTPGSLICIDEMAADTDPREGAAIASAVLEALVEAGGQVMITTHLDEVKAKGLTDPRFMAASVEFDFERLAPTYKLKLHVVGASSAIEIARRVGLPELVCDRARELLGGSGGALGRAVAALEAERAEARRLEEALDRERRKLEASRQEWERQRRLLEQRTLELKAGLQRDLVREIDRARAEVRRTLASLQADRSVKAAVEAQQSLAKAQEEAAKAAAREEARAQALAAREAAAVDPSEIRPGQRVTVASLGREGEVTEVSGATALVTMGSLKTRVPLTDLVALTGRTRNAPARFKRTEEEKEQALQRVSAAAVESAPGRVDVRGRRTEDALRAVRHALDAAVQSGARELLVVHGHGTGALKKAVREELDSSPYVQSFRPGEAHEGGDGITLVTPRAGG